MFDLVKQYRAWTVSLVLLAIAGNGINLLLPSIIARGIDAYTAGTLNMPFLVGEFLSVALIVLICAYLQSIVQAVVSERVARDLRETLAGVVSRQGYAYVERAGSSQLLTNLTSDIDAVKSFISSAIPTLVSSVVLIVGTSSVLLWLNWQLALGVLALIPLIGGTFFLVLRQVHSLFIKGQEAIDGLNKIISESILGAALVRVLHAAGMEQAKFMSANTRALEVGMSIVGKFAGLIPFIMFCGSMATLYILLLGGHFVVTGTMSLGDFAAFNAYLILFIFPVIMLGVVGNIMARASGSYARVAKILDLPAEVATGGMVAELRGDIGVEGVAVEYGEKSVLRDVSFTVRGGTKTAIIGPTAAGKTQLLNALVNLITPSRGAVKYDGHLISDYDRHVFHRQVGFVFQDSIIFNTSIRENIAFNVDVSEVNMARAIATAELTDFIAGLPEGLETLVSERGTSLSGGQKQRIMLARALATNPHVLLLDDFTARVDLETEQRIIANITANYPGITIVSITQKIAPVEEYDQIILLMEGELIAQGTHKALLAECPEYVQIYNSQHSTHHYELPA